MVGNEEETRTEKKFGPDCEALDSHIEKRSFSREKWENDISYGNLE